MAVDLFTVATLHDYNDNAYGVRIWFRWDNYSRSGVRVILQRLEWHCIPGATFAYDLLPVLNEIGIGYAAT